MLLMVLLLMLLMATFLNGFKNSFKPWKPGCLCWVWKTFLKGVGFINNITESVITFSFGFWQYFTYFTLFLFWCIMYRLLYLFIIILTLILVYIFLLINLYHLVFLCHALFWVGHPPLCVTFSVDPSICPSVCRTRAKRAKSIPKWKITITFFKHHISGTV